MVDAHGEAGKVVGGQHRASPAAMGEADVESEERMAAEPASVYVARCSSGSAREETEADIDDDDDVQGEHGDVV